MKEYYTIEDLAMMTMLSTRTIRNYIKQGFLVGEKQKGSWHFTPEEIDEFYNNEYVRQSLNSKKNSIVFDFLSTTDMKENSVCSIYDYTNIYKEEADHICNKMMELVNSNRFGCIQFAYTYKSKAKMARIILVGAIGSIHSLINEFG